MEKKDGVPKFKKLGTPSLIYGRVLAPAHEHFNGFGGMVVEEEGGICVEGGDERHVVG